MAFVIMIDTGDGCDRESYNIFYADIFVAETQEEADFIGDYELAHRFNEMLGDVYDDVAELNKALDAGIGSFEVREACKAYGAGEAA